MEEGKALSIRKELRIEDFECNKEYNVTCHCEVDVDLRRHSLTNQYQGTSGGFQYDKISFTLAEPVKSWKTRKTKHLLLAFVRFISETLYLLSTFKKSFEILDFVFIYKLPIDKEEFLKQENILKAKGEKFDVKLKESQSTRFDNIDNTCISNSHNEVDDNDTSMTDKPNHDDNEDVTDWFDSKLKYLGDEHKDCLNLENEDQLKNLNDFNISCSKEIEPEEYPSKDQTCQVKNHLIMSFMKSKI